MAKQKSTENKDPYERELADLVQTLLEKAKKLKSACLIAVETEGVTHLSGDLTDASPQLQEAFALLLQAATDEAEHKTLQARLRDDLAQCKQEHALLSGNRQALTKVVQ